MNKTSLIRPLQFVKQAVSLYFAFIILLFFSLNACTNDQQKADPLAATPPPATPVVDSFLDVLYLTNFSDSPQLQTLNQLITSPKPYKKFVFQFFNTASNKLTLGVWAGTNKNQGFDTANVQILSSSKPSGVRSTNLAAFFGDLQITDTDWKKAKIDTLINKPNARYIFFSPIIKNRHIVYEMTSAPSLNKEDVTAAFAELNPSPPRPAD